MLRTWLTGFLCCYRCSMETPFFNNQWQYFLQEKHTTRPFPCQHHLLKLKKSAQRRPVNQHTTCCKAQSVSNFPLQVKVRMSLPLQLLSVVGVKGVFFFFQFNGRWKNPSRLSSPGSWFWALKPLHRIECLKKWPNGVPCPTTGFLKCRVSGDQGYSETLFYLF